MFIVYWNNLAIVVFCSRDDADEYIRNSDMLIKDECTVDYVDEDEDLYNSINSHA